MQATFANSPATVSKELCQLCRDARAKKAMQLMEEYPAETSAALLQPPADTKLSALAWACSRKLVGLVKYMTEHFAFELRDSLAHALFIACRSGEVEMVEVLMAAATPGEAPGFGRCLCEACRHGHRETVNVFLRALPEEARAVAGQGFNEASLQGHGSVARTLLEAFPDEARVALRTGDGRGNNALHGACRHGLLRLVRELRDCFPAEFREALRMNDENGWTPPIWAMENQHEGIVQLLLEQFPDSVVQAPPDEDIDQNVPELPLMVKEGSRSKYEDTGYRLVGSHSAVKMCRWTRNALYGQGQCYKHTFYGISSHQCMEATPSLACANKCTFCWRNHLNPVATSWKFQEDDPDWIVRESVRKHQELVADAARSPVARPERVVEARTVRHTALSLVGEPVLYPQVQDFITSLHKRRISTFLVTNGQFPDQLEQLPWVTQLYVSLDAPDATSLKEIGRPLFKDYWERLRRSLVVLREKHPKQRTVCRLTVLKGQNMTSEACEGYAELVRLAEADFVEVKGATFAPVMKTTQSGLSYESLPSHHDVREFAAGLVAHLPGYGMACEHEHSCGMLLARKDRFFDPWGCWHTWIDYDRFADAAEAGEVLDAQEFAQRTPDWAVASGTHFVPGQRQLGFDPEESRRYRKRPPHAAQARQLPRHKMMCDVAVLSPSSGGDDALMAGARALLELKHVRTAAVFEPWGTGLAPERVGIRHIAGDEDLNVTYKEFGLQFRADLARRLSRFSHSQGSCEERQRIRALVQPGERVLVLGSGIGLATCILARQSKCREVVGIEADPVAHEFAVANVKLNGLEGRARCVHGDPRELRHLGKFDRVCAFLTFKRNGQPVTLAANMAPAAEAVAHGGTLHIYDHETNEEFADGPQEAVRSMAEACGDRRFELTWRGKVPKKSIGRNWFRIGLDFRLD